MALEKRKEARKPTCHYPSLTRQFKDEPDVLERLCLLDANQQANAAGFLASQKFGPDYARDYILGEAPA